MSKEKTREWWPVGIVAAMLGFMGFIVFAVTVMMRNDVPLTSEDYYAREIAYQGEIDQRSRALAPAHKPVVRTLAASEAVEVTFPGAGEGVAWAGEAAFFRPSDPRADFSLELRPDSTGSAWLSLRGRDKGLWVLQLSWRQDSVPYYYEEHITL
jgi:hypothetical protein